MQGALRYSLNLGRQQAWIRSLQEAFSYFVNVPIFEIQRELVVLVVVGIGQFVLADY